MENGSLSGNLSALVDMIGDLDGTEAMYFAEFTELNGSGAAGGTLVVVDDGVATVVAGALGLEGGQDHAMHVHGFGGSPDADVPTLENDLDGDGFVELLEGAQTYGPVQVDISPGMTGERFIFTTSFNLDDEDPSNGDLTEENIRNHEIVLHGRTLAEGEGAGDGEADGTPGYKPLLPIAAGELEEIDPKVADDLAALLASIGGGADVYFTRFEELNDSGAAGGAIITVSDGTATVFAGAKGVEPGEEHLMHVHGFGGSPDADVPGLEDDLDGDGFIELLEGAQTYGPVQVDISPGVTGERFTFSTSFELGDDDVANGDLTAENLENHEIVLHGLSLAEGEGAGDGEADGTAGYKTLLPIAAGQLVNAADADISELADVLALIAGGKPPLTRIGFDEFVAGDTPDVLIFGDLSVDISAQENREANPDEDQMIFDSANPTGEDMDLATPSQGNVLIISEDDRADDPDDSANGGTIVFDFSHEVDLKSIVVIDANAGGSIEADTGDSVMIPDQEDGRFGTIDLSDFEGVQQLTINLTGSSAIDDLIFDFC